jgi:peptidoglycan/LPS O-acetylase OafA/YrhL
MIMPLQHGMFERTLAYSVQGIALTIIFIAAVRFPGWPLFRPLNLRAAVWLGTWSYSLYLVHNIVLRVTQALYPQQSAAGRAFIALAGSLAIACMLYMWVERPCGNLRRRLTD